MTSPYPFAARPTVYRGVQMRSRLEARVAEWMDSGGLAWQYEPRVYKSESGEYLPDFQVGERTFIEVKPSIEALREAIWESIHRAAAVLIESCPQSFFWVVRSDGTARLLHFASSGLETIQCWPGLCPSGHLTLSTQNLLDAVPVDTPCRTCSGEISWLFQALDRWQS
jgi:hypothetical protein